MLEVDCRLAAILNEVISEPTVAPDKLKPFIVPDDYRGREFAGASFDPSGRYLFVNVQTPGVTFAIRGPWERGRKERVAEKGLTSPTPTRLRVARQGR